MPQKRMECFRLLLDYLAWIEHQFLSGIRDSRKAGSLWGMMRGVGGVKKSIHHSWSAKISQSFMCVLSIKVPIQKQSGNLFNDPCTTIVRWRPNELGCRISLSQYIWFVRKYFVGNFIFKQVVTAHLFVHS